MSWRYRGGDPDPAKNLLIYALLILFCAVRKGGFDACTGKSAWPVLKTVTRFRLFMARKDKENESLHAFVAIVTAYSYI